MALLCPLVEHSRERQSWAVKDSAKHGYSDRYLWCLKPSGRTRVSNPRVKIEIEERKGRKKRTSDQLHAAEQWGDDTLWQSWLVVCHFMCHPVK